MRVDYPEIRPETRALLENPETREIEYKQSIAGLDASDMVAFANANGGTILIGVQEIEDESGRQRGEIVGQRGSFDDNRNAMNSMASSCRPPLNITIVREQDGDKFIYRVDIEKHSSGLCCTSGGRYVRREDGSKKAIDPTTITAIVLEKESTKFIQQLEESGRAFVEELSSGQESLNIQIREVQLAAQTAIEAAERAEYAARMAESAAHEASAAAQDAAAAAEDAAYG